MYPWAIIDFESDVTFSEALSNSYNVQTLLSFFSANIVEIDVISLFNVDFYGNAKYSPTYTAEKDRVEFSPTYKIGRDQDTVGRVIRKWYESDSARRAHRNQTLNCLSYNNNFIQRYLNCCTLLEYYLQCMPDAKPKHGIATNYKLFSNNNRELAQLSCFLELDERFEKITNRRAHYQHLNLSRRVSENVHQALADCYLCILASLTIEASLLGLDPKDFAERLDATRIAREHNFHRNHAHR